MRAPFIAAIAVLALVGLPGTLRAQAPAPQLPPGKGSELTATLCSACHTLQPILMKRDGPAGWRTTVDNMTMRGLRLFRPGEPELIVEYLSQHFGPGSNPMRTEQLPPGTSVALPAGEGKDLVEMHCTGCHDLGRVVSVRRTKADWERVTRNMVDRGSKASADQVQRIVAYLAGQFGNSAP